jgi:hypothetical protein
MTNEASVATVFRDGGDYRPEHVELLRAQIPGLVVLGLDVEIPPHQNWPGWWAKMNLFDPARPGDILYFDLDTIITGPIEAYRSLGRTHVLRDFYAPKQIGSGVLYIAEHDKPRIWDAWISRPEHWMATYRGDQEFLEQHLGQAARWQDEFPNEILSYKKHITAYDRFYEGGHDPLDANVICFHGYPRPWDAKDPWIQNIYSRCVST